MKKNPKVTYVKRNINMLEYPMWIPSRKLARDKIFRIDGKYELSCQNHELPNFKDIGILNSILALAQAKDSRTISATRYCLIKKAGLKINQQEYKRFELSLNKWQDASFKFAPDVFYYAKDQRNTAELTMGIISHVKFGNPLVIEFDLDFWSNSLTNYSLELPVNILKGMNSPYSMRLFEILYKNFRTTSTWSIGIDKLIAKMPMYSVRPCNRQYALFSSLQEIGDLSCKFKSKWYYEAAISDHKIEFYRSSWKERWERLKESRLIADNERAKIENDMLAAEYTPEPDIEYAGAEYECVVSRS